MNVPESSSTFNNVLERSGILERSDMLYKDIFLHTVIINLTARIVVRAYEWVALSVRWAYAFCQSEDRFCRARTDFFFTGAGLIPG